MYKVLIQRATKEANTPSTPQLRQWAKCALKNHISTAEMTIRIVDIDEMTQLNSTYRHKNKPTNVLSFPFDMPKDITLKIPLLGDIIICAVVVLQEALTQQKPLEAHWAHMVVHGTLHLLGFDHETEEDAISMEADETAILKSLGYNDPYLICPIYHGNDV